MDDELKVGDYVKVKEGMALPEEVDTSVGKGSVYKVLYIDHERFIKISCVDENNIDLSRYMFHEKRFVKDYNHIKKKKLEGVRNESSNIR